MFDTALVLLVIAGLLVVVADKPTAGDSPEIAATPLCSRRVGVGIGAFPAVSSHLGLSGSVDSAAGLFADLPVSSATFIYVFLPLLVFEAGYCHGRQADHRRCRRDTRSSR